MIKNEIIQTAAERFPDLAAQIKMKFDSCESFREICEDYVLCLNSIKKIDSTDENRFQNLKEFKEALRELEDEMLSMLKN